MRRIELEIENKKRSSQREEFVDGADSINKCLRRFDRKDRNDEWPDESLTTSRYGETTRR